MKLLAIMIDWEYPAKRVLPAAQMWDLMNKADLMDLYMALANGVVLEMRVEADSVESIDVFRGLLKGAGSCAEVTITADERKDLWLYQDGFENYKQGAGPRGYFFVNPIPQSGKFEVSRDQLTNQ